ncbi:hypothetical protein D8871_02775 [Streptococcus sanguinis]|uniref:Uncharacterized protein n=1 Tax=Streptococcus sanguinis SK330 TaxID=888813 RepID=F2CAS0_STRSA|nr:hypothetical protein HMPREF9386_2276 [Streptococcus sanguinis SK330]RSI50258.1 hypothetical protein D8871_02775 [Streptococcus sanguinis]
MYSDEVIEYYKKGYRRIYDNFFFSFKIYACDCLMMKRACVSTLKQLEQLNQKSISLDQLSTYRLMLPYKQAVERELRNLEKR